MASAETIQGIQAMQNGQKHDKASNREENRRET
jgi:hypothetical protein